MSYTMAHAKRERAFGAITKWEARREGEGWGLILDGWQGRAYLVDARAKEPRIFRTLDALMKAVEQIGFRADQVYGLEYVETAERHAVRQAEEERQEAEYRRMV